MARYRQFSAPREKFPWKLFLVLVVAVGVFVILPWRTGPQPVQVDFSAAKHP